MADPRPRCARSASAWSTREGVYAQLGQIAEHLCRGQPVQIRIDPAALVHEAYLRLAGRLGTLRDHDHLIALGTLAMRQVLVDRARRRASLKRGGRWSRVGHPALGPGDQERLVTTLDVRSALEGLAHHDARSARTVALRHLRGLTIEETARALGVSRATVQREEVAGHLWLRRALGGRS